MLAHTITQCCHYTVCPAERAVESTASKGSFHQFILMKFSSLPALRGTGVMSSDDVIVMFSLMSTTLNYKIFYLHNKL